MRRGCGQRGRRQPVPHGPLQMKSTADGDPCDEQSGAVQFPFHFQRHALRSAAVNFGGTWVSFLGLDPSWKREGVPASAGNPHLTGGSNFVYMWRNWLYDQIVCFCHENATMNGRSAIRLGALSFAAFALLVFSTTVVSDWDCHSAADDLRCPYCHLTHQAPAKPEIPPSHSVFQTVASLPLPEDSAVVVSPVLSNSDGRAPPAA